MKISVFKDYDEMSQKTSEFITDFINGKPDSVVCFSAGSSPAGTFKRLVRSAKEGKTGFGRCSFVCLDEYLGLNIDDEGGCNHFMFKNLFNPLSISKSNIVYFDACSQNLDLECKKVDDYLSEHGPIDLMVVGIGVNGHVGMNEPGISFDLRSHVADLHPVTMEDVKKLFGDRNVSKGITLGIKYLMEAKCVIIIANGTKKADAVKKIVEGEVTNEVPASFLKAHPNSYLFLDAAAASGISVPNTAF